MLVVVQWVGHRRDGVVLLRTEEKEVWVSGKKGEWCRIGMNGEDL